MPPEGLVLSSMLGRSLGVRAGDAITVEVLEGEQAVRQVRVAALVDDILGLSAYMDIGALRRLMREGGTVSASALRIDPAREAELAARVKELPAVAGVAFKRTVIESFRETLAQNMGMTVSMTVIFAGIIAFGVVYNASRVSLSERSRELASLRVLGFRRAEISLILLGELAVLTLLALPVGTLFGLWLTSMLASSTETEVYRFPVVVAPQAVAWSWLTVMAASLASGLVVRRQLDRLDLVAVLKIRE
jgi:putative ABC transport system permease protein